MKIVLLLSILISSGTILNAQNYFAADTKILNIPDSLTQTTSGIATYINSSFIADTDKVRAIFAWTAGNITYDIDNMFAINFYETEENKISKALLTRKGICENYAAVFNDLCSKTGIKSFVIAGYTKQNGSADYVPHAWCAAFINNSWSLYDPTWGAGYVQDGKFVKKINNLYFNISPQTNIKSHMPFDPMWELLNYPVTNAEFYSGNVAEKTSKKEFNFIDSIKIYQSEDSIHQLISSKRRIQNNGVKSALIFSELQNIEKEIYNIQIGGYNSAGFIFNNSITDFNKFIDYRNKQFTPLKPDDQIKQMLDTVAIQQAKAKTILDNLKTDDPGLTAAIASLINSITDASTHLDEQKAFLKEYLIKGKNARKAMFIKPTWFGIPVK